MSKKKIVIFLRKKRDDTNSIEEIFHSLIKYMDHEVELVELPYSRAGISSIVKNIYFAHRHRGYINHISGEVHYIALGTGLRTLITIHDVNSIVKGHYVERTIKTWLWFKLPLLIARKVSVISQFTLKEVVGLCPFAKRKTIVINNPVDDTMISSLKTYGDSVTDKKYIMHVGTRPNKNLEGVLKSMEGLPVRLAVVGRMTAEQKQLATSLHINFDNYYNVPRAKVAELYAQASLVTFPSFYEGFGMPIIEANLMGVPILASDIDVLHEVAGTAAYFVNPNSVEDMRHGIIELLDNKELRTKLIESGKKNANRFAAHNIANQYMSLYEQLS